MSALRRAEGVVYMFNRSELFIRMRRRVVVAAAVVMLGCLGARAAEAQAQPLGLRNIIQQVDIVNGGLVATTVQGQALPLQVGASPRQGGTGGCAILNLSLGPIDLNLLGLQVDTSQICLDVTGERGPGNLLGNLLCTVAGLLDRGVPLSQVLANLTAADRARLTEGIRQILNGALNELNEAVVQAVAAQQASCAILNLAVGPLDLNLLGLRVQLDNCANGPVTVDVTAVPGAGNLLGNLLCGVLGNATPGTTLGQLLQRVLAAILGVLNGL